MQQGPSGENTTMPSDNHSTPPEQKNISIDGDVVESVVIAGDHNTVNQTIIQKFFNIFKSDAETLEQRNRRILLNHVENAWIKGVLDASLHGAALLELGIKEDPDAVKKYPWTIKKEATDETLPAGISMLEIFESIGLGRSLLILGAPGSGKTTMLLELARQLIAQAREDVTQPIPIVFNLASWTEKLSLANWLAQELNLLYSIPRKTAPEWVKSNKLLLLLDGLDEVRQESRAKCLEAINAFRKENGLTSLAVCSRSQNYLEPRTRLNFDGAVEIQPLVQDQIDEYLSHFPDLSTINRLDILKHKFLRDLAQTPLFLNILVLTLKRIASEDVKISNDSDSLRKALFDAYIYQMFDRSIRNNRSSFSISQTVKWLGLLAQRIKQRSQSLFLIEKIQPDWLNSSVQIKLFGIITRIITGTIIATAMSTYIGQSQWLLNGILMGFVFGLIAGFHFHSLGQAGLIKTISKKLFLIFLSTGIAGGLLSYLFTISSELLYANRLYFDRVMINSLIDGLYFGFGGTAFYLMSNNLPLSKQESDIRTIETIKWSLNALITSVVWGIFYGVAFGLVFGVIIGLIFIVYANLVDAYYFYGFIDGLKVGSRIGIFLGLAFGISFTMQTKLAGKEISDKVFPNQGMRLTLRNGLSIALIVMFVNVFIFKIPALFQPSVATRTFVPTLSNFEILVFGLSSGIIGFIFFGGNSFIKHWILRIMLRANGIIPINLVSFLDHCVDLIFLRRVGGGYIFVHRLLMEHFAEMDEETINRLAAG